MKTSALDKMLPSKWLQLALLFTATLTLWAFLQEDNLKDELVASSIIEPADNRANSQPRNLDKTSKQLVPANVQDSVIDWKKLKRDPSNNTITNPFKVHSWLVVPPVKKVKPAPPPIPTAPPAPFTYMGKYEETQANTKIFLLANDKLYSTTQGNNIDTQWRLDGEDANSLRLTYLPLNLPQVLSKLARPIAPETMPATAPVAAEMNL